MYVSETPPRPRTAPLPVRVAQKSAPGGEPGGHATGVEVIESTASRVSDPVCAVLLAPPIAIGPATATAVAAIAKLTIKLPCLTGRVSRKKGFEVKAGWGGSWFPERPPAFGVADRGYPAAAPEVWALMLGTAKRRDLSRGARI